MAVDVRQSRGASQFHFVQTGSGSYGVCMTMHAVLHSFSYALDYLREQVADVDEADLAAQPISEGGSRIMNHPAWIVGHVTFACQMLGEVIGVNQWLPSGFAAQFGPGSRPLNNAAVYEPRSTAMVKLDDAQARIITAVEALTDARLDEPFPDPAYREVFPTIRHALTQVLVGHAAYHIGQLSIWRKAMGLKEVKRSFE